MDSVAERTTDRGITTALNYAVVMARPGDEVAAGDGLGAFGAALILSVQMHSWRVDRLCRNGSAAISAIHACLASINIERGYLIAHDLLE
jgi:hypothetical protein